MSNLVSPMEIYEAARETCLRLYIANGGDARDHWIVQPYPGTAAIASELEFSGRRKWTLSMPALPLNVRVPRWQADLIAAYTVHELLHALWSDWNVVRQSHREGLAMLTNALEDVRIEGKASAGALRFVSEARRLLQILNAHIYQRAAEKPAFNLADPNQFAFVLTLVIFSERLGYVSAFPQNWRELVAPHHVPVFEHALTRYPSLASTADALQLARELRDMAKLVQPKAPEAPAPRGLPVPSEDDSEDAGERDSDEAREDDEGEGKGEGEDSEGASADADDSDEDEASDEDASEGASGASGSPLGDEGEDTGADDEAPAGGASDADDEASDEASDKDDADAKAGDSAGMGDSGEADASDLDLSDKGQNYSEANLDDLSSIQAATQDGSHIADVINAPKAHVQDCDGRGNAKLAGAKIATPARLRRHVTQAVKSPERVGNERYQTRGRLDMRNVAGIASGAENIFRRRIEDEGREAAVSLLVDVSSSMEGERIDSARALALHMGDALKAAGVKFEISTFRSGGSNSASMTLPKAFAKGWNSETKGATAGMRARGGTTMLPAIKHCAERLLALRGAVSRRILIVLTDGLDGYDARSNELQCKALAAKGVETLGLGLMLAGRERTMMLTTFARNVVFVDDCATLATAGLAELVKQLDKGAPRAA